MVIHSWIIAALLISTLVLTACSSTEAPAPAAPAAPAASAAPTAPAASTKSRLDIVIERGTLICGVNANLPGFGRLGADGKFTGFDIDFCRAIAAALFNDAEKVEYRALNAAQRFTAVQTGEVDVLIRNTTWSLARDTSVGLEFAPVTFYDGQGMMVRANSGVKSIKDMNNMRICVQTGTTTELNLADYMRKHGIAYTDVVFAESVQAVKAYDEGKCDGYTTDRSGLIAEKTQMSNPNDHMVLADVMSKEPLGPSTLNNDSRWFDAVKWITWVTIEAEELGLTSANVDSFTSNTDPTIRRFLGVEGKLGTDMGLPNDFAHRVVKKVGNYAEIYDRNLGPNTPFNLPRGINSLWTDGGLHYSPPFR